MTPRLITPLLLLALCASGTAQAAPYQDPALPVEQRVEDLLSRMTPEEKVGQMCQYLGLARLSRDRTSSVDIDDFTTPTRYDGLTIGDIIGKVRTGEIGSFLNFFTEHVAEANQLQHAAAESRLGIPLIIGTDAIHGHAMAPGTTCFPVPIGLAASFDEHLVEQVYRVTAVEMRATGFAWAFSPNVEVARDMRWGRVNETYGEDPLLVSRLGVAHVHGLQGDLSDPEANVIACVKHFIGGSQPFNGLNHGPADMSERMLREVFLPPFAAGVKAGAWSIMAAHNEVNGVPCHANRQLLTDVLKDELGFQGFVVSDWADVSRLCTVQHIAASTDEAAAIATLAGIDMNMHGPGFFEPVLAAVKDGRIPASRIDDAVRRILRAKFILGLFEHRYTDPAWRAARLRTPEHVALSLAAARKALVLLRNEGGLLPLSRQATHRIFLSGPNANNASALGNWAMAANADALVTIKAGLEQLAAPGSVDFLDSGHFDKIDDAVIRAAAERARGADVAVLALGGYALRESGLTMSESENSSRDSFELPGRQLELLQAVSATGVPVVVVLQNGGPIASPWMSEHVPAILEAFYPGQQGGRAIAEALFGETNPSGRLPYSIPRDVGHSLAVYYHRPGHFFPGSAFAGETPEMSKSPLYPFGFGLSYTTFGYSNLRAPAQLTAGTDATVTVDVSNTGSRAGDEIVLAFLHDEVSSVTSPVKPLKDFSRVSLQPGETKTVTLRFPADAFALFDARMQRVTEPGEFTLTVADQQATINVTAP